MPAQSDANAALPSVPDARDVLKLAWPMTLKAIFLHGTVVIDGWMVSALGEVSLAALGLAAAIGGFVTGVIFAFANAMQIRTAQAFGTKDPVFMKSVLVSGMTISLAIGAVGVGLIFVLGPALTNALAPDATMASQAWTYLSIFSIVIVAEAVGQCLSSHFNGCGRVKIPLYGYCLSVPINVAASLVLIHGAWGFPAFGIAGAAMGSALGVGVQALFLSLQLWKIDGPLSDVTGWHRGTFKTALTGHLRFAWPIAATFVSANSAARVCMLIYAQMSLVQFAAMTLIMPWVMVAGTVGMQWAQATGIIVAQLLGERRDDATLDRFLSAAWRASFLAAGVVALVYLVICLGAGLFYPALSPQTQAVMLGFAFVLVVLPFPKQSNAICGNTLRASGDTVYVMHVFIWSQWLFRVPATAIAVLIFAAPAAIVLSLLFWEEVLKFPAFHRRLWRGAWKRATVSI